MISDSPTLSQAAYLEALVFAVTPGPLTMGRPAAVVSKKISGLSGVQIETFDISEIHQKERIRAEYWPVCKRIPSATGSYIVYRTDPNHLAVSFLR